MAWAPWPATADPSKDSAYAFDSSTLCKLRTLDYTGNLTTVTKHTDRLKNVADHLTATATVDYYAYLDDEAALKVASFQKSPHEEQYLLQAQDYLRVSLEMQVTGASPTAALGQQIHGFEMPLRFLSRVVSRHTVHLIAASDQPLGTGGQVSPRGSYHRRQSTWTGIVEDLRELRKTQASVDCIDEDGRRFKAYLADIAERTAHSRDGGDPTKVLTLSLLEVSTT